MMTQRKRHPRLSTNRRRKINPALSWKAPVNPALGLLQSLSFRKCKRVEGMLPKDTDGC